MSNVSIDDLKHIMRAYQYWKLLNKQLKTYASRTVNFPEAISEALVCYELGYYWHNKAKTKEAGDATFDGNLIEIKATSNFHDDLTSFSPNTKFDVLIFARLHLDEDKLYIYDLGLNSNGFQNLQVNKTEKTSEQQVTKRRPRLSLIKNLIIPNNLKPVAIMDLKALVNQLGV